MDGADGFAPHAPIADCMKRPRQNRVTPFGTIEATPHKGTLMGNRGDLHAPDGTLGRQWRSRRWLSCILNGDGWRAPMDTPGHYYPLFFHDEAVAIAAGHRPCGECRPAALERFIAAWKVAQGHSRDDWVPLRQIDQSLHHGRTVEYRHRPKVELIDMPDGAFVWLPATDNRPLLVRGDRLFPWSHAGYDQPLYRTSVGTCAYAITSTQMIGVLRADYVLADRFLQPVAKDESNATHVSQNEIVGRSHSV